MAAPLPTADLLTALVDALAERLAERLVSQLPARPPAPPPAAPRDAAFGLLSLDEAARQWCCSRSTIERMIERGELRSVRLGSDQRIPASQLRDWVDRHLAHERATPTPLRRSASPRRS